MKKSGITENAIATPTHCIGVSNYWISTLLAGREIRRDRDAEFRSRGNVAGIREAVRDLQERLSQDISKVKGEQPLANPPNSAYNPLSSEQQDWRQGRALIHAYEELAQHYGQMELTRDILIQQNEGRG